MDFTSIIASFFLILVAELGDKTQLAVISLSCRYPARQVFFGAMLGFLLVDGVSIVVGGTLLAFLPIRWITVASGCAFILFGAITLLSKKDSDVEIKERSRFPWLASFYLIGLSEVGDKTQIAAIALAGETSWYSVLLGVMLAFGVLVSVGVVFGAKILVRLPKKWLKIGSACLFIILGILSIASAFLGVDIL